MSIRCGNRMSNANKTMLWFDTCVYSEFIEIQVARGSRVASGATDMNVDHGTPGGGLKRVLCSNKKPLCIR